MRILFVSSEVAPFAKTGGLGDVAAALPRHLQALGHEVLLFVPLYARVRAELAELVSSLDFQLGPHRIRVSIMGAKLPGSDSWMHAESILGKNSPTALLCLFRSRRWGRRKRLCLRNFLR